MRVIDVDCVAEALPEGLRLLIQEGAIEDSRAGRVVVAPWPVATVYRSPWRRVLLSAVRDANPFFHLAEALWMLAGRRDAKFLNMFISDFGERFAEPNGMVHGAYGHRWRTGMASDQLDTIVERMRREPGTRQAVLQMWDQFGWGDLDGQWRDRPCNTHAYFRVRDAELHMTVCCRSNDIIWGAYGANAVHFSMLQEYLAARIGVNVGTYTQVSNNFHAYVDQLERMARRAGLPQWGGDGLVNAIHDVTASRWHPGLSLVPLVADPGRFDDELKYLLRAYETEDDELAFHIPKMSNPFLSRTAWPVMQARRAWTRGDRAGAAQHVSQVAADDWRVACGEWIGRRMEQ